MTTTTPTEQPTRRQPRLVRHGNFSGEHGPGPVDSLPTTDILALLPKLPTWPQKTAHSSPKLRGAKVILDWLLTYPGGGWQDRWLAAGADRGTDWIDEIIADVPRTPVVKRNGTVGGLNSLLLCRVVLPSYK